ncbi:MAG: radical SAM protein [Syntrophobacteraceae bacterium]
MDGKFFPYPGVHTVDCGRDPTVWATDTSESLKLKVLKDRDFYLNRVDCLIVGLQTSCQLDCIFCTAHHAPDKDLMSRAELSCDRLVEQVLQHKEHTGQNIAQVKFGCIGEVLINPQFIPLVQQIQETVDDFEILSNLSIRSRRPIDFIAGHPQISHIIISCDSGDAETYSRLRVNGDFDLVLENAGILARAGKKLSMHAIIFRENEQSLLKLPKILKETGFEDLHIIYSYSPLNELQEKGVDKLTREEFREFFLKMLAECKKHDLMLSTSTCFFTPDYVGVIPGIETEARLRNYQIEPCENLYRMTVTPEGSFYHCCYLDNMGFFPKPEKPFYRKSLLDMYNDPIILTHRKLQMLGYFPDVCKRICSKIDNPKSENQAALIRRLKYPDSHVTYSLAEFDSLMAQEGKGLVIRALSPAVREVLAAYPRVAGKVEFIIDRDRNPEGARHPVVTPEEFKKQSTGRQHTVLIGSEREAVFNSVLDCADRFEEIYRLNFSRRVFGDYKVTRLLP